MFPAQKRQDIRYQENWLELITWIQNGSSAILIDN